MKRPHFLHRLFVFKDQAFQVIVVACLAALGLWGHKTHWSLSSTHAESDLTSHTAAAAPVEVSDPATHQPLRIRFPSGASADDLGIQSAPAQRKSLVHEVSAAGMVSYEPALRAQLSARCPGTVWRVEKQLGQDVQAGDVLAIIETAAVGQAKADFLHAIADVEFRLKVHERLNAIAAGAVPAKMIDEAQTVLRKARADLFNAQQALINLGMPVDLDEAQSMSNSQLQTKLKFLGLPESMVVKLDPNATTANLLPIVAPFSGTVIGRGMSIGELVAPGETGIEIADVSKMWIVMNVREQDAEELELGQSVVFTAGPASVTSWVSWLSTAIDEKTRTVEVRCETENPVVLDAAGNPTGKRLLRANLFGTAKIRLRERASAFAVPTKAVQWFNGAHVIFVESGEKQVFEARSVRTGIVTEELTEIIEGLSDTESVVVEGSHILKAELQRSAASAPPT